MHSVVKLQTETSKIRVKLTVAPCAYNSSDDSNLYSDTSANDNNSFRNHIR
jgi:hypothetical protein